MRLQFHTALKPAYDRLLNLHLSVERSAGEAGVDPLVIELVKIRASQVNGCAFCVDLHTKEALEHGETARRLALLPVWRETGDVFSDQERTALALAEAICRLPETLEVPDDVYAAAADAFDEAQLAVVVWATAVIQTFNAINVTSRKPLPA